MSQPSLIAQLGNKLLSHVLTGARPVSAGDGVDLATWKTGGGYVDLSGFIYFSGTLAASLTAPTGGTLGVELWGFKLGQWWLVGSLNNAAAIPIVSATLGAVTKSDLIGGFDRLFVAATTSAGTVTAQFVPLEVLL